MFNNYSSLIHVSVAILVISRDRWTIAPRLVLKNLSGRKKNSLSVRLRCQKYNDNDIMTNNNNVLVPSWFLVTITRAVLSFYWPNKPCLWLSYWNWCCIEHKNSDAAYKLLFCGYRSPQLYRTMAKWSSRWWI